MKREIQVRVEYTDGYKERFTSACIEAIRRRESYEGTANNRNDRTDRTDRDHGPGSI